MTSRKATFYCSKTTHFVFILCTYTQRVYYDGCNFGTDSTAPQAYNDHIYKVSTAYIVVVVWSLANICQFVIRCVTEGRGWWKNSLLLNFTHTTNGFFLFSKPPRAYVWTRKHIPAYKWYYMVAGSNLVYVLHLGIRFYALVYMVASACYITARKFITHQKQRLYDGAVLVILYHNRGWAK